MPPLLPFAQLTPHPHAPCSLSIYYKGNLHSTWIHLARWGLNKCMCQTQMVWSCCSGGTNGELTVTKAKSVRWTQKEVTWQKVYTCSLVDRSIKGDNAVDPYFPFRPYRNVVIPENCHVSWIHVRRATCAVLIIFIYSFCEWGGRVFFLKMLSTVAFSNAKWPHGQKILKKT